MNTYKATVKIHNNGASRTTQTEIRAITVADAKWLLQAIFGFHAITAGPTQINTVASESAALMPSPEQQRIKILKQAKDRASKALKVERDKQKRAKAVATIRNLPPLPKI